MRTKLYKQRHANWQEKINISFLLPIFILLTSVIAIFVAVNPASAATSSNLNFQGRLATNTGGLVPDGSYNIEFKLYDDALAGSNLWTENRTGGNTVTVRNGYFSVYLGEVTPFSSSIPWDQDLWLTMNVNGDGEMSPRFKLTAVPYAFRAGAVTDSAGNAFTGDDLAQLSPSTVQAVNSALSALRLNQTGAGGLLQLQGDGSDVFTIAKDGATTIGAGLTLGNSTSTTAGTIRWSGTDLEVYDGSGWTSLTAGGGGGGGTLAFDAFYAYDAVGNISLDAGWTDITLDTEVKEDAPYTHAADSAQVTINEDGWYEVTYNLGLYTSDANNNRGTADAKLQENTGGGFVDIPGSEGTAYLRGNGGEGNVSVTLLRQFTAGDIIKIQAQRSLGSNTSLTLPNSAGLTIKKFVDAGSGGGTSFEQNGNDFGGTAILGTTSADGLTIITNNSPALTFTSAGNATFANTLTVSGGLNLTGDISATAGLTIASGGSGDLELDSASGTIILSADTLQRSASGTTTIDLYDAGGATTLSLLNSDGTQVAGLSVEGGVSAASFSGDGSSLTTLSAGNISSGTLSDLRLSSNVALLDQNQTFTGTTTFNTGLVLGNSTSTTTGAVRWSGSDFEGYDGVQWVSLTSSGGGGGGGGSSTPAQTTVVKSSDEIVNNSAALQDDNQLTFAIGANENWAFRFVVQANSGATPDLRFAVTAPVGASCVVSYSDPEGATSQGNLGCGVSTASIPGNGTDDLYEIVGTVSNGATAGNVTLQWAQFTPNASNTTVRAGSYVLATIEGGGQLFLQGGNDFGGTAILGTTSNDNLNFITNGSTALSLTTSNQAVFSGEILANGGTTLGDSAGDGLTIVSSNVTLTNGLNFDSDTFVIDSANNRVGIGTATTTNLLTINDATTADAAAQVLLATEGTGNKGLVIQTSAGQSASALEIQNSGGGVIAGFNANGGLVLGLSTVTSSATVSRNITLPDADGTICLSGSASCGYVQFANGSFQTDASTANTLAINKTNATGNLIELQRSGSAVFTVANSGALQIQSTSTTALDIRNTSGSSFFSVDTSTGTVRVGPTTADGTGVLFVLDTKNTSGDPTGTPGAQYYNSNLGKFRCYENGQWKNCINSTLTLRSFIDTVSDPLVDANTTNYWDTGAENNNSVPNITLASAGGSSVYGTVSFELTSSTNQDVEATARVVRNVGTAPDCNAIPGTAVGGYPGIFATNTGSIKSSTVTFVDTPPSPGTIVYYTLCSDAATAGNTSADITRIRFTLQEVTNNN